jgi:hypothetical protein
MEISPRDFRPLNSVLHVGVPTLILHQSMLRSIFSKNFRSHNFNVRVEEVQALQGKSTILQKVQLYSPT